MVMEDRLAGAEEAGTAPDSLEHQQDIMEQDSLEEEEEEDGVEDIGVINELGLRNKEEAVAGESSGVSSETWPGFATSDVTDC